MGKATVQPAVQPVESVTTEPLTPNRDQQPAAVEGEKPPVTAPREPALTWAQVQQALDQQVQLITQQLKPYLQSQMDKRAAHIESSLLDRITASKQQAERVVASAKKSGLDEKAAANLGKQYLDENIAELIEEEQRAQADQAKAKGQQPAVPEPGAEEQIDQEAWQAYTEYVTQQGDRLREAWGLDFADPEMKNVQTRGDEEAYYESIKQAGMAKRTRLEREAKAKQPVRPGQLPALGPDGGAAPRNTIANITDAEELYELAEKRNKLARVTG